MACVSCENQEPNLTYKECVQCAGSDNMCNAEIDSACVIYHSNNDRPSKLDGLNLPNLSSAETIFEAIDDLIGNGLNIDLIATDSTSIDFTTTGTAKHHLTGVVKISSDENNGIEIHDDGLYVPFSESIVSAINGLYVDSTEVKLGGSLTEPTAITTGSTNTLTINGLVSGTDLTYLILNSSNVLKKRTFTNSITTSANIITSTVSGIASTANIVNSIGLSLDGSGNLISTVNGIASSVISLPLSPALTADNGLTKTANNVQLGGTLTQNTIIDTTENYYINFTGNKNTISSNKYGIGGFTQINTSGTENAQYLTCGVYAALGVGYNANITPNSLSLNAGITAGVYKTNSGSFLGTYSAVHGFNILDGAGNVTTVAGIRVSKPLSTTLNGYSGTIGKYAGLLIEDTNSSGGYNINTTALPLANRYAIYQVGAVDKNLFNGEIISNGELKLGTIYLDGGAFVSTTSSLGTVVKKLKIKVDGTYYYIPLTDAGV